MNNVVLLGRLTRDPELRYTGGSGMAFARFTIAVDRGMSKERRMEAEQKGQPTADFIGCVAWGKTAETIANYFSKGKQIAFTGRIQTGSYEAQDGSKRYTTDVVVERFEFIYDGSTGGQGSNFQGGNQGGNRQGFNQGQSNNIGFNQNQGYSDDYGLGNDAFPSDDTDIPF